MVEERRGGGRVRVQRACGRVVLGRAQFCRGIISHILEHILQFA